MRLIIAGSRGFSDYEMLRRTVGDFMLSLNKHNEPVTILSGTAKGADKLGERYAKENGHALEQYPADWNSFGKAAGYLRNKQMAQAATHCIVFWDGVSKGAHHMWQIANEKQLPRWLIKYVN